MFDGSPRILIVRLSAIGDVVRTLAALDAIRSAYPEARIDWAVEQRSYDVVSGHPAIDDIHVFDRHPAEGSAVGSFLNFCRHVRDTNYDIVVDFHGIFKSGFLTRFSGAKQRIGFSWPRSQECSTIFYNRRAKLPSKRLSRVEENLILCEAVSTKRGHADIEMHVPDDVQESIDAYFAETFEGAKKVVAVHVPVDRPEKQWPLEYFAECIDHLMSDGRFEVVLTYGPGQMSVIEKVLRKARRSPHIAPATPDLKHYAWLALRSDLYFGGDTGPMHVASAMGTPVVAIFGGTDPMKHAPHRKPYTILWGGGDVEQWTPVDLAGAEDRMRAVTAEMAYDACVNMAFRDKVRPALRPAPDTAPENPE
jgi:lipopolysaccharide heptosyltransferase I